MTSGAWAVREILHVDETKEVVTFLAAGLVDADPYLRQICHVHLDGTGFSRLTDDADDHLARQSPSGEYIVDTASRVDEPPVTVVRDRSGAVVLELERADVTALVEAGWTEPERFTVLAADGVTDIYGILWRPHGFDPTRRYPVIDHIYPGPQSLHAPPGFENTSRGEPEALASLGFAVVVIDGRGTPGRSKAFHDHSYGHLDDAGSIDDHVAAITQLAAEHDWLDIERVGAMGHSAGASPRPGPCSHILTSTVWVSQYQAATTSRAFCRSGARCTTDRGIPSITGPSRTPSSPATWPGNSCSSTANSTTMRSCPRR